MARWISLMDYATRHDVSLSTLRRYIKAKKVEYKIENGRYLLLETIEDEEADTPREVTREAKSVPSDLESKLQKAHEEIAELKTLIAFYEENIHSRAQSL